ncbi:MAG: hypothetical protein O2892_15360 [Actinomycetota bacterium]|nr:hypothetical protein [Actinomycetota bacterium]MDA2950394.1 hypothetical protein [Actinomycetota bacterium]
MDSIDKLEAFLSWAHGKRGLLRESDSRLWVIGAAVRSLAGSAAGAGSLEDLHDRLGQALAGLVSRGWELAGAGAGAYRLARGVGVSRVSVQVLAQSQSWLAGGDPSVTEDAEELGRRLRGWTSAVGVVPEASSWASGAALYDAIVAAKAARVTRPSSGALPEGFHLISRSREDWVNDGLWLEQAFHTAQELVWLEQRSGPLASAGMLNLGVGEPTQLRADTAASALRADKRPFGLWLATLPAGGDTGLPDNLPLPHPLMSWDESAQVWLTSEDLTGLGAAIRDGGAGLNLGELEVAGGLVWPRQGRVLEAWATRLREAMRNVDSPVLSGLLEAAAADYLDGLGDPARQPDHYQPVWAAALDAHVRFRTRRAAMRISREYQLWPLLVRDTGLLYPVGIDDSTGEVLDLADTHTRLGRLEAAARVTVTEEVMLAVLNTEGPGQLAAALTAPLNMDPAPQHQNTAAQETPVGRPAGSEDVEPQPETVGAERLEAKPAGEQQVEPARPARRKPKAAQPLGGVVAAVLDIDGLWLPDGTRVEVGDSISHVGDVAQLAWTHKLGFRLTDSYSEPGQIWLTEAVCRAVGIDVDAISRRDPNKSLRELTKGLPFVDLAAAAGFGFGGAGNDKPEKAELGTWTRVYLRDNRDLKGPFIVLMPGIVRGADVSPIIDDAPPAQLAHRLQLFADEMRFPFKVNNGVTGIDLMLESRPKTRSPKEWRDEVFAPSQTKPPYGIADIEYDFDWSRLPNDEEAAMGYLHAYDRGGSYMAAIPGLELPIGNPTHHPDGAEFDAKLPGYWCIEVPEQQDWLMPYILNPRDRQITTPKWVCTPRLERAAALGYEPKILEAYIWADHGRVLRGWYERFRDLSTKLDIDDPDAQAVRNQSKVIRNTAIGLIASRTHLERKTGYSPERRFHIVSKASASITYKIHQIGTDSGRWPVAVVKDTIYYTSDDPDPATAWPGDQRSFGRGFGQYKPEASGRLADQLQYLTGKHAYRGKEFLTKAQQWRETMLATPAEEAR